MVLLRKTNTQTVAAVVTCERYCASVSGSRLTAALLMLLVAAAKSASAAPAEDVEGSGSDPASLTYQLNSTGGQQLYTVACSSEETKDGRILDSPSGQRAIQLHDNHSDSPLVSAGEKTQGRANITSQDRKMLAARGYFQSNPLAALIVVGFYDDNFLDHKFLSCKLKSTGNDIELNVKFEKFPARRLQLTVRAADLKKAAKKSEFDSDPHLVLEIPHSDDGKPLPDIRTVLAKENVLYFLELEAAPTTGRNLVKAQDHTVYIWRRLPDKSIRLTIYAPEKSAVAFAAENNSLIVKACFGEVCFRLRSSSPSKAAAGWPVRFYLVGGGAVLVVILVVVVVVVCCVRRRRARRLSRSASAAGRGLNPDQANELNTYTEHQRAAKANGSGAYGEEEAQELCHLRSEIDFVDLQDSKEPEKVVEPPDPLLPKSTAVEDPNCHESASSKLVI